MAPQIQTAKGVFESLPAPQPFEVSDVSGLSESELKTAKSDVERVIASNKHSMSQWESYNRLIHEALEAALQASLLKTEPDAKKRRRTATAGEFDVGSKVAFRLPGTKPPDDEWISCEVVRVLQDGARYEVQDPEPDENNQVGKVHKATPKELIALPGHGIPLPDLAPGTIVLAQYPETTAFYRAEVTSQQGDSYRVVFRGEEDTGVDTEVDRHFILETK